jgi:hypothetical protein
MLEPCSASIVFHMTHAAVLHGARWCYGAGQQMLLLMCCNLLHLHTCDQPTIAMHAVLLMFYSSTPV